MLGGWYGMVGEDASRVLDRRPTFEKGPSISHPTCKLQKITVTVKAGSILADFEVTGQTHLGWFLLAKEKKTNSSGKGGYLGQQLLFWPRQTLLAAKILRPLGNGG